MHTDDFSSYYSALLDGAYDCVDRIVLNAYYPFNLKKLRGKEIIRKRERSRKYETISKGLHTLTALLVLRDKVVKPVLAAVGAPKRSPKPKNPTRIDIHYRLLQQEMHGPPHLKGMVLEYYDRMGWDRETGKPSKSTLKRLGLDALGRKA